MSHSKVVAISCRVWWCMGFGWALELKQHQHIGLKTMLWEVNLHLKASSTHLRVERRQSRHPVFLTSFWPVPTMRKSKL